MMNDALNKFAASDLRAARQHGELRLGGTKRGTLALRHAGGVYTLTTQGLAPEVVATGKPAVVRPALAALYVVEVQ